MKLTEAIKQVYTLNESVGIQIINEFLNLGRKYKIKSGYINKSTESGTSFVRYSAYLGCFVLTVTCLKDSDKAIRITFKTFKGIGDRITDNFTHEVFDIIGKHVDHSWMRTEERAPSSQPHMVWYVYNNRKAQSDDQNEFKVIQKSVERYYAKHPEAKAAAEETRKKFDPFKEFFGV